MGAQDFAEFRKGTNMLTITLSKEQLEFLQDLVSEEQDREGDLAATVADDEPNALERLADLQRALDLGWASS